VGCSSYEGGWNMKVDFKDDIEDLDTIEFDDYPTQKFEYILDRLTKAAAKIPDEIVEVFEQHLGTDELDSDLLRHFVTSILIGLLNESNRQKFGSDVLRSHLQARIRKG
jgi:hypothetical protein